MTYEEIRSTLISNAVRAILTYNGQLLYSDKRAVRYGKIDADELTLAVFCLVDSVIAHNIPIWKEGKKELRDCRYCFRSSDVFGQTNIDEEWFITVSKSLEGFSKYQVRGDFKIGRLAYRDDTHEVFKSGSGSWLCDFVDLDNGHLIEAKYNYFDGSPSSLHDAEYLLDYGNYDAKVYKTIKEGKRNIVLPNSEVLAEFKNIMTPRSHLTSVPGIGYLLMSLINSGELIPEIERRLAEEGFKWNP